MVLVFNACFYPSLENYGSLSNITINFSFCSLCARNFYERVIYLYFFSPMVRNPSTILNFSPTIIRYSCSTFAYGDNDPNDTSVRKFDNARI